MLTGDHNWQGKQLPDSQTFDWDEGSTYMRRPSYFDGMPREPEPVHDITWGCVLALLKGLSRYRPHLPGRRDHEGLRADPLLPAAT